ncbi:GNAT family N-acetyltransferase [Sutterella faecalis]|uniref:GNAT family N-acetyltransferase n=2 Tax=Sutterella TaxID=40544 RepID=A0AAI9WND7_9BURK|nr:MULTISPECIES: GNAT family N-acetyltransferase [Sutterella]KAB7651678.1 GNAT family N-acetyltransferase [Sutterella seckii]QDA53753.1 GNAT family N-acetyltransferase [Sutterella faecalis]
MASFLPPRPLQQADETRLLGFDCGSEPLNRWLAQKALHNDKTGGSRTYVVSTETGELAGYFCLSAHSVEHGDLKAKYRRNMPNPVPTILLGRLAVDKKFAGRGLGKSMLSAAIRSSIEIAKSIGVAAVVVHPISEEAEHFYLKNGFAYAREGNPMLLFALGPFISSK